MLFTKITVNYMGVSPQNVDHKIYNYIINIMEQLVFLNCHFCFCFLISFSLLSSLLMLLQQSIHQIENLRKLPLPYHQ
ncbi:50S ribosomal protein L5 [Labeo rohita]|uniref:50S ribosomal protein L5 n=1 Tax=Labeo rohita TaxID=84645 RepID=A0ABQ8MPH4_LABRO|nr:50S ribosomal protein L5 [Labeo rohita]